MFAEDYPRFIEVAISHRSHARKTDDVEAASAIEQWNRMNERYEALFASDRDMFEGARVLDLASHDGRYSFAR